MTVATEKNLLLAGVSSLVLASVVDALLRYRRRSGVGVTIMLVAVATLLLMLAITVRWAREQQGPFLTLYDVLLSNLFSLGLLFLIIYAFIPVFRAISIIVLPFFVLLGLWLISVPADAVPLPATFDNSWLWLHVTSGKIFLGLCLVAAASSTLLLLNHFRVPTQRLQENSQQGQLDAAVWPVFALAFVCHSFMLIAGAVWAHSAWGRYWAWDPLETWALITWLALALLLHARVTYRHMPAPVAWASVIAIFVLAFLTFFGVPFVSVAPHKGII